MKDNLGKIDLATTPASEIYHELKQSLKYSRQLIEQLVSDYEDYLTIERDPELITIHERELKSFRNLLVSINKI